jgi:hypothetical protein
LSLGCANTTATSCITALTGKNLKAIIEEFYQAEQARRSQSAVEREGGPPERAGAAAGRSGEPHQGDHDGQGARARSHRAAIRIHLVLATIAAKEETGQNVYVKQRETAGTRMSAQERWHAKVLKQVSVTSSLRRVFRLS